MLNYKFSEIPNDKEGRELVRLMRKYLNKDSYKIRVKGQYLKDELKENRGWRKYNRGQPLDCSKCLRVYIDDIRKKPIPSKLFKIRVEESIVGDYPVYAKSVDEAKARAKYMHKRADQETLLKTEIKMEECI